ncbi:MAG: CoB--CoM heterodisulfide reductase iron-sulfur subunit A family protein [Proteobacteria bacterium]|nr:CoB--CoM heterodisulfide reductase iron-sulfur subunit A family protein [Pseudomonadota bacterium]
MVKKKGKILVIGGGISGISTALEAAETGFEVILVEKTPALGGRVSGFHQYFPKLCPPACGLEINYRRLRSNPYVQVKTSSEVKSISGEAGNFKVTIHNNANYINAKCVLCDDCLTVCPGTRSNSFNFGMDKTKAVYLPHKMAYPARLVIDREACETGCDKCVTACKYDAIDLNAKATETVEEVASIVYATGWRPYHAGKIKNLGFSTLPNVINNVMFERLAAISGPTKGKVLRPSDNKAPDSIAFVQCAGSRDENHLPYCSSICCLASFKHVSYIQEVYPDAKIYMFYIDIRTPGKYEGFAARIMDYKNLTLIKGKVGKIVESEDQNVTVEAEDILSGNKVKIDVQMAVLATGMEPNIKSGTFEQNEVVLDPNFFVDEFQQKPGIFSTGVAKMPSDVNNAIQDSTGTALKAIQIAVMDK